MDLFNIFSLPQTLFMNDLITPIGPSLREFAIESIRSNISIIDSDKNWNVLLYKEALHITLENPILNVGLKATRKLLLFN